MSSRSRVERNLLPPLGGEVGDPGLDPGEPGGGIIESTLECAMKLPVAFALIAAFYIGAASAQGEGPRGDAQTGKQLFESKGCYSCHGFVGQGSREGPRLAPPLAFAAFLAQRRTPRAIMPPATQALAAVQY